MSVRTFEHSKSNSNVVTSNLARRLKNKYASHKFLDRTRIANNFFIFTISNKYNTSVIVLTN